MENPILYVVLNKELKMSAGKAAAQAVHAAMMLRGSEADYFTDYNKRTVIVLEAENTQQILNLQKYLAGEDIASKYYIDEGVNEVGAYSITALAVEPFFDSEKKREIFAPFNLFSGDYRSEEDYNDYQRAAKALRRAYPFTDNRPYRVKIMLKMLEKEMIK